MDSASAEYMDCHADFQSARNDDKNAHTSKSTTCNDRNNAPLLKTPAQDSRSEAQNLKTPAKDSRIFDTNAASEKVDSSNEAFAARRQNLAKVRKKPTPQQTKPQAAGFEMRNRGFSRTLKGAHLGCVTAESLQKSPIYRSKPTPKPEKAQSTSKKPTPKQTKPQAAGFCDDFLKKLRFASFQGAVSLVAHTNTQNLESTTAQNLSELAQDSRINKNAQNVFFQNAAGGRI